MDSYIHSFLQWVDNLLFILMLKLSDIVQWGAPSGCSYVFWTCHHYFLKHFLILWSESMFQGHLVSSVSQPCNHPFLQGASWFLLVGNGRLPISLFSDLSFLCFFFWGGKSRFLNALFLSYLL